MSKKNGTSRSNHLSGTLAVIGLGLVSLMVTVFTLPQDLTWGDSPELAACAWILGIPHPTGYPLYMLAVHLFQQLPFGTVIFRAHLFSAVCMVGTCLVLFYFLRSFLTEWYSHRISLTVLPALVSSLAWSLTIIVWSQSRMAEVYTLFAFQFALALWLFTYTIAHTEKTLPLLAFLFGLMCIHHRLSILLIAIMGLFLLFRILPRTFLWFTTIPYRFPLRTVLISVLWGACPLLFMIYFPLRARTDPAINWYDPVTLTRFYQLVSGQLYSSILTDSLINALSHPFLAIKQLTFYMLIPFLCYSILAVPIVVGFIPLFIRKSWLACFMLITYTAYQVFVALYPVGDQRVFILPSLILLTLPLATGIAYIVQMVEKKSLKKPVRMTLYGFLVLSSVFPFFVHADEEEGLWEQPFSISNYVLDSDTIQSRFQLIHDRSAAIYATRVWTSIHPGSPIITGLVAATADNELYPLLYQQIVEKQGEQSPLVGAGFLHFDWYRKQISERTRIHLPSHGGTLYRSRDEWWMKTWEQLIVPLLEQNDVYTTSFSIGYPPPSTWTTQASFQYLGMIPVDGIHVPASYRSYLPGGHLYKMSKYHPQTKGSS